MTTTTDLTAALLRDVPRFRPEYPGVMVPSPIGVWVDHRNVLAALTAALDGVDERAGAVLSRLRPYAWAYSASREAADLITALLAQNAALRAERDEARAAHDADQKAYLAAWNRAEAAEAQIAALTARVEGLTGAAKRVLAPLDEPCRHDHHGYCQTHFVEAECSVAALRAALSATTEEGHE